MTAFVLFLVLTSAWITDRIGVCVPLSLLLLTRPYQALTLRSIPFPSFLPPSRPPPRRAPRPQPRHLRRLPRRPRRPQGDPRAAHGKDRGPRHGPVPPALLCPFGPQDGPRPPERRQHLGLGRLRLRRRLCVQCVGSFLFLSPLASGSRSSWPRELRLMHTLRAQSSFRAAASPSCTAWTGASRARSGPSWVRRGPRTLLVADVLVRARGVPQRPADTCHSLSPYSLQGTRRAHRPQHRAQRQDPQPARLRHVRRHGSVRRSFSLALVISFSSELL